jgi:S-adenosylmethionine synthetase
MKGDFIFTSESVTEGHPDKLCDLISDAIVDQFLLRDPFSRVIAECAVSTAIVFIAARFASDARIDFPTVARQVIDQVGYNQESFNARTCGIIVSLTELPAEEYRYFDERSLSDEEIDRVFVKNQETVFGFACNHTPGLLPLPIWLAHRLARRLTAVRLKKTLPYLAADGKTQVAVEFRSGKPYRIHSVTVIASQERAPAKGGPSITLLREDIRREVIGAAFQDEEIRPDAQTRIFVNPDGPFAVGGPSIHSGLTGRKSGVDNYGGYSRHTGAALSGKGPLRIDRTGSYAARYVAKNIVAAGLADLCEVQLSYTIGMAGPASIQVETFGTGKLTDARLATIIEEHFDLRLAAVIRQFNLRFISSALKGGFYRKLAAYGHVGRMDIGLPWELVDKASALREA